MRMFRTPRHSFPADPSSRRSLRGAHAQSGPTTLAPAVTKGLRPVHPPYRFVALKWHVGKTQALPMVRKLSHMVFGRLLGACLSVLACLAAAGFARPAAAQANFDRPGGDYTSAPISSGDPADCALLCEHDRRCRAWSFNYPTVIESNAVCWLKGSVPARVPDNCCVSGVRGAGTLPLS